MPIIHGYSFKDIINLCDDNNNVIKSYERGGGIHNVIRCVNPHVFPKCKVDAIHRNKAYFYIYQQSRQYCFTTWNLNNSLWGYSDSDVWNHYCYIDKLDCQLKEGVPNSIDFCTNKAKLTSNIVRNIECADYIFLSSEEGGWLEHVREFKKKSSFVSYDTQTGVWLDKEMVCQVITEPFIDTIGAGDYLAGFFIKNIIKNLPDKRAIKEAVQETREELCQQNKNLSF